MPSPRSRRALIAQCSVSVSALAAGCLGDDVVSDGGTSTDPTTADGPSIAESFDCENASRPEPDVAGGVERELTVDGETRTETSVGSVDYPSAPDPSDDDAVVAYAAAHEEAYRRNDLAADNGEDLVGYGFSSRGSELVDRRDGVAFVRVEYVYYANVVRENAVVHADSPIYAATYAVSDWGVARAVGGTADADGGLDPHPVEDGTLVACFE
ncbi:hypothetical protein G9464_02005 [Halostella sp. JP-L12]|uniref:hypothetical protein n=1 Tax=Halostella TaxID=1843185 RepID=UPI000EF843AF|nr:MULTISPECIES: hypothetical protein [Halostella]NHN46375.1 hypothetical protein [Halostella sp. JP-L12]